MSEKSQDTSIKPQKDRPGILNWKETERIIFGFDYTYGTWCMRKRGALFTITNYVLVCTIPAGHGESEKAAFKNLIEALDAYMIEIKSIRDEAAEHLQILEHPELKKDPQPDRFGGGK